jgi:hypothetical protein
MSGVSYYSQLIRERSERTDGVEVVAHEAVEMEREKRGTGASHGVFEEVSFERKGRQNQSSLGGSRGQDVVR